MVRLRLVLKDFRVVKFIGFEFYWFDEFEFMVMVVLFVFLFEDELLVVGVFINLLKLSLLMVSFVVIVGIFDLRFRLRWLLFCMLLKKIFKLGRVVCFFVVFSEFLIFNVLNLLDLLIGLFMKDVKF